MCESEYVNRTSFKDRDWVGVPRSSGLYREWFPFLSEFRCHSLFFQWHPSLSEQKIALSLLWPTGLLKGLVRAQQLDWGWLGKKGNRIGLVHRKWEILGWVLTKGLPDNSFSLGQPLPFLTYLTAISEVREKDSMRLRTPILSLLNENYSTMAPMCFRGQAGIQNYKGLSVGLTYSRPVPGFLPFSFLSPCKLVKKYNKTSPYL